MFSKIQDELAKMIAKEIYNFAKGKSREVLDALKETTLRPSGSGLPSPILVAFQESFLAVLSARVHSVLDGYTCLPDRDREQKFHLLLREPLVTRIQQTNWVAASSKTADGVDQIKAVGGLEEYQTAVSGVIGELFDYTASKYVGVFHATTTRGWRLLSGVIHASAAPEGTTQFKNTAFLYYSAGSEEDTANEYRLSKKLLTTGLLWWKKLATPSAGPYITAKS
ncbi:MAG TPA: hypothetical protein VK206_11830 [Anaerolineales bacterium]|nr:hypothetical protein [Anaerolineales bacterium]HLO29852.1 hypothetical protein [Anaerolineales bacterium]